MELKTRQLYEAGVVDLWQRNIQLYVGKNALRRDSVIESCMARALRAECDFYPLLVDSPGYPNSLSLHRLTSEGVLLPWSGTMVELLQPEGEDQKPGRFGFTPAQVRLLIDTHAEYAARGLHPQSLEYLD